MNKLTISALIPLVLIFSACLDDDDNVVQADGTTTIQPTMTDSASLIGTWASVVMSGVPEDSNDYYQAITTVQFTSNGGMQLHISNFLEWNGSSWDTTDFDESINGSWSLSSGKYLLTNIDGSNALTEYKVTGDTLILYNTDYYLGDSLYGAVLQNYTNSENSHDQSSLQITSDGLWIETTVYSYGSTESDTSTYQLLNASTFLVDGDTLDMTTTQDGFIFRSRDLPNNNLCIRQ